MNSIVSRLTRLCICEFDPPYLVRADTNQGDVYSSCDFENSSQPVHLRDYLKADYELYPTPSAFNYSQGTNETCQMLKNFEAPVGVGKLLKVMATDDLQVSVDYYIPTVANPTSANANGLQSLVQAIVSILNNTGYSGAMHGQGAAVGGNLQHSIPLQALMQQQSPANPTNLVKAYLNVLFSDACALWRKQFNFICQQSQYQQLSIMGSPQTITFLGSSMLKAPANGYVYIYVSNESRNPVYIDNFQVLHQPGRIVEETHYYPFGLVMSGISSKAAGSLKNKEHTFQDQRFDDDLGLDWVQFKWRNHDPQIGRFIEIDPLADKYVYNSTYAFSENKVTSHVELEGLEAAALYLPENVTSPQRDEIIKGYDNTLQKGANAVGFVGFSIFGLTNPEVGIPMAVSYLSGVPVTPAPQAMSRVAAATMVEEESGALAGGRKGDIPTASRIDRHEIPSAKAMKDALGVNTKDVPAIQLPTEIHAKTATFGFKPGAAPARAAETALIKNGNIGVAFSNGVKDVQTIVNSPEGQQILNAAGLKTSDENKAINAMTEYFKKTF